ncbi:hypothetical protein GH714_037869 [Hevea brasiliensis]|uniref:Pectinesterase n=1 Tax=Hevea brasiliensis TaxID=3981 RepID=A0A6A6K8J4_HEVBR|nr:hypothetical protein GH714_037869 [Hevea brasiliensis]
MSRFSFPSLFIFLFLVLIVVSTPYEASSRIRSDYLQNECLKVPIYEFVGSLKTTIDTIQDVTSTISNFGNFVGNFRLTNAITDCLDLLDFSADELSWSMSASQNPKGKNNSTGDLSSDLRTWLSAAFVNQGTCIDGFEGISSILKSLVAGGLNKITSSVQQLLNKVDSNPKPNYDTNGVALAGRKSSQKDKFPAWFKREDRKLLVINGVTADAIVAADGTGNFTKIMDAVSAAPDYSMRRYVIYIKKGFYNEYVEIKKKKWNLMMVGDGMGVTVISGNRSVIDGWTTFRSATFAVSGRGFIARDITFENTAGAAKHQAVALRSDSDLSVFFRCEIKGYQDTLYTHTMRQFYRNVILAKKGLSNQKNTITAQGRKDPNEPTGFSIQFCNISADIDLLPYTNSTYTYLGWLEWSGDQYLDTLHYGEYLNYGPGAGLANRVKWPGYHIFNTSNQANNFTVAQFIEGNLWLPSTGVRYTAAVSGEGFLARDITIENTAGPQKHQAVALRIYADLAALYRCTINGYQDTLYVHSFRQFYRECNISGTIDYIFGKAAVVFQAYNVLSNSASVKSYLGRPWRVYSRTVILEFYIDDFIDPTGWTNWFGDQGLDGLYYGEYDNYGPGSAVDSRVTWPGFHIMDAYDVYNFTVSYFITGDEWLHSTSFPYDDGI